MSPSDLKLYATDLTGFYRQKILGGEKPKGKVYKGTEVGSMVDVLFTDNANFHKYYVAVEEWKATEKVKEIIDKVFERVNEQNLQEIKQQEYHEQEIIPSPILSLHNYDLFTMQAIEEIGYYPKWGMDTRMKSIKEKGTEYFEQLKRCDGREMQPFEWFTLATQKHKEAMEDKHVGKLCRLITGIEEQPGIEILRQHPMYGEMEVNNSVYKIKGLNDTTIVNHANKTIQPYDIKVAKTLSMFLLNAKLSRYDIQGDMYDCLIKQILLPKYPVYLVKLF